MASHRIEEAAADMVVATTTKAEGKVAKVTGGVRLTTVVPLAKAAAAAAGRILAVMHRPGEQTAGVTAASHLYSQQEAGDPLHNTPCSQPQAHGAEEEEEEEVKEVQGPGGETAVGAAPEAPEGEEEVEGEMMGRTREEVDVVLAEGPHWRSKRSECGLHAKMQMLRRNAWRMRKTRQQKQ